MTLPDRVSVTIHAGITTAASDSISAVGAWIKAHPEQTAGIAATTGAVIAAQAIPGVDVGVDVILGTVGAVMYATGGLEHQANITHALGRLHDYAVHLQNAKTPADLQRASADFAGFLKIGGKEAVDALAAIGGIAAAPTKLAGLAQKIQQLGGLKGVMAAGSTDLTTAGAAAQSALKAAFRSADGMASGFEAVGEWLDSKLAASPKLQPVTAAGSLAPRAPRIESAASNSVSFSQRYTLRGEEGARAIEGHTLKKHVAQSEAQLRNRFKEDANLDYASTFSNEGVANRVVGDAVKGNEHRIQSWLRDSNNNKPLVLDIDTGRTIGKVLRRGAGSAQETSSATVVLTKSTTAERGYFVRTAYPSE